MTQDALWMKHYNAILQHFSTNGSRPSKHKPEEIAMHYWIKYNKRKMREGKLSDDRADKFKQLLELCGKYRRKNQYAYLHNDELDICF